MSYIGNQPLTQAQWNPIEHTVTATATYNVNYTVGFLTVILNGATLPPSDYTAADGLTLVLNKATEVGDSLQTVALGTFVSADNIQPTDVRLATAWCVFDGTLIGTNAPIAGYNVTSVTRTGVGLYTINFTTALDTTNFSISGTTGNNVVLGHASRLVSSVSVATRDTNGTFNDGQYIAVHVFGGKN